MKEADDYPGNIAPSVHQNIKAMLSWSSNEQKRESTCRHWLQGHCKFGGKCRFRHAEDETCAHLETTSFQTAVFGVDSSGQGSPLPERTPRMQDSMNARREKVYARRRRNADSCRPPPKPSQSKKKNMTTLERGRPAPQDLPSQRTGWEGQRKRKKSGTIGEGGPPRKRGRDFFSNLARLQVEAASMLNSSDVLHSDQEEEAESAY